jgi:transposase-like protein
VAVIGLLAVRRLRATRSWGPGSVLVELSVVEQRYRAVLAVLAGESVTEVAAQAGESVTEVAAQVGVSRQTVHTWLARYRDEGLGGLVDRSHRPEFCPHQAPVEVEAARIHAHTTVTIYVLGEVPVAGVVDGDVTLVLAVERRPLVDFDQEGGLLPVRLRFPVRLDGAVVAAGTPSEYRPRVIVIFQTPGRISRIEPSHELPVHPRLFLGGLGCQPGRSASRVGSHGV